MVGKELRLFVDDKNGKEIEFWFDHESILKFVNKKLDEGKNRGLNVAGTRPRKKDLNLSQLLNVGIATKWDIHRDVISICEDVTLKHIDPFNYEVFETKDHLTKHLLRRGYNLTQIDDLIRFEVSICRLVETEYYWIWYKGERG